MITDRLRIEALALEKLLASLSPDEREHLMLRAETRVLESGRNCDHFAWSTRVRRERDAILREEKPEDLLDAVAVVTDELERAARSERRWGDREIAEWRESLGRPVAAPPSRRRRAWRSGLEASAGESSCA